MKRGDVVVIAGGKPRPAVIIQSDHLLTPVDVLLCPFTTHLLDAPYFRVPVAPNDVNGLTKPSQLMVDKVGPARRDKIGQIVGHLGEADIASLATALLIVLDLAAS